MLQYKLKCPKESKQGKSVIVDVYQSRPERCPVAAFTKWLEKKPPKEKGQPVFRWSNGTPLTSSKFNTVLRGCLKGFVKDENLYSSHSFRAGAASMLATLGYSDSDIKALGRWNSRSFEAYIKAPRSKRAAVARILAKCDKR